MIVSIIIIEPRPYLLLQIPAAYVELSVLARSGGVESTVVLQRYRIVTARGDLCYMSPCFGITAVIIVDAYRYDLAGAR